ncbi:MAG: AMP-binding protein [Intrasporangiaceae bacterium]|nr:AMP-binding protein [Intrasporangiaceae bacterium]
MPDLPNRDPATGAELDITAMLGQQADRRPDHTFIHTPSGTLTYAELLDQSARLAGALTERGVKRGTPVAVMMANSIEQVTVWFALARIGALHAPLNTALIGHPLRHVMAVAKCTVAVVDDDLLVPFWDAVAEQDPLTLLAINRAAATGKGVTSVPADIDLVDVAELIATGTPRAAEPREALEPATLLFTSGTTGVSKACTLSRRYLAAQGAAHAKNFALGEDDVLYCPFPLFHIDAATLTVVAALSVGGTAALSPRFSASRFWDEVRACDATVFNFMGATLSILFKQPPSLRDGDHRVRLAWGVPMPQWQHQWESRFGVPLYQVYGSTDAGVPVYDPLDGTQRPGTCGRVTDHFEVRISDDQPVGEILVRGRHPGLTMSGYYAMPEATAATIDTEGWVHTGDLGSLDDNGFLTFHGRTGDSIRRRGENISAFEVEEFALTHPDILEAAAIGVPSELTEEDVKICVVARPGATVDARSLREHIAQRAPRHMVPRYYEILDYLPKTPTHKVKKHELKNNALTDRTWDAERNN